MQRIQFYPSKQLVNILDSESSKAGVSVSQYVTDLLEEYFGLTSTNGPTITQLTSTVLKEVEEYIKGQSGKVQFDLLSASATYSGIDMVKGKKPSTVRASIGRAFAAKVGSAPFTNVRRYEVNGKQVLSVNNALMYETF